MEEVKLSLKNVRLSFPKLFQAEAFQDGQTPRYQATFLLDADDPQVDTIKDAIKKVAQGKWKDKAPKTVAFNGGKSCAGLGDDLDKVYDGYENAVYIRAGNTKRVTIVDRDLTPLVEEDGKPYAGCYVNATLSLWAQDNQFGKRVNGSLRAVQFVKDGESFGAGPVDAASEFDALDDADSDDIPW
jgi:hypothetical protein